MKLRRLRIAGFKTFARETEVVFDRGITAIVGPNGSGKSNLVDAVRWALGETNARELRGQRMDEVIYAGGAGRSRLGVAEVELTLDNEEGRLPVEDPEVALSRRVVRGAGDTEYRLNGDRVRLREVERLLTATGLTQSGYAVVAQNDIDAIIEATPAHRRMLVEQAAGVRHLRGAGDEALHRVARAEAVVVRLDDLLDDAEPRLAELEDQASAALEQRAVTERLSELRGSLAREEWRAARARLRQARRAGEAATGRLEAAREAERAFSERIDSERAAFMSARATHVAALERLEAARLAAERAAGERRRWSDRMRVAVLQRAAAVNEVSAAGAAAAEAAEALQARRSALQAEARQRRAAAEEAAHELVRAESRVEEAARHAEQAGRGREEAEAALARARDATAGLLAREASVRGALDGIAGGSGGVARAVSSGVLRARRIWDCVSAREGEPVPAVEAALEPVLGAWLVDDVDLAARHLDASGPREQLLDGGVAPVDPVLLALPGKPVLDALDMDAAARGPLTRCLAGHWLAPDLGTARAAVRAGAIAAVIADGTLVTPAGLRGGGLPGRVLELAAEERRIGAEVERARAAEAAAASDAAAALQVAAAAETSLARAAGVSRSAGSAAAEAMALATSGEERLAALERGDDETRRVLAAAGSRLAGAEQRLLAAETDAIAALVRLRAAAREQREAAGLVGVAETEAEAGSRPLAALEQIVLALEAERAEVAVALARAEDDERATAAGIAAAEDEVAALAETVLGEAEEEGELDPKALERAEREIVRLERRIAAMGPVNALAPEQHEALTARVSSLQRDRADLGVAAADIRDLTSWLMRQLDERFNAIFGAVSFHFHQLFAELFPGGRATLRLEEPSPADDGEAAEAQHDRRAGVEILAQPPGKRLGALRLLSGGERALTALATILALQQVNPSPFYIFDEVDAALDDTNVMRFVRLLQRLAGMQQFIVVTHNHITMAAADSLWGVTIDSEGVSTVIGVRFEERMAPAPGGATALPQPVAARAG